MTKIEYGLHDDIAAGKPVDLERTVMVFSIGTAPHFSFKAIAAAAASWQALKIKPSTAIVTHFGGFDEDPRELWEIPEVRRFVQRFCAKTDAHKHPALEPTSRAWMLACDVEPGLKVHVDMITEEKSLDQSMDFFRSRLKETP
jgi:hypothetical protein